MCVDAIKMKCNLPIIFREVHTICHPKLIRPYQIEQNAYKPIHLTCIVRLRSKRN